MQLALSLKRLVDDVSTLCGDVCAQLSLSVLKLVLLAKPVPKTMVLQEGGNTMNDLDANGELRMRTRGALSKTTLSRSVS